MSLEKIVLIPFGVFFGGVATIYALLGDWQTALGVLLLAVVVGAPLTLIILVSRKVRQDRRVRAQRREYEAGLLARFNGAVDHSTYAPPPAPRVLPDAEQMRQQAWQPELYGQAAAVRPSNPAPWHVVTQFPTRQFQKPADDPEVRS
ncbi:hypothetical protein BH09ACT8_BH09ACT8_44700 [soil metagenome]